MRTSLFALALITLLSTNLYAFECNTYEAQVAGKITEVSRKDQIFCHYKVELNYFSAHVYCPLTAAEIAVEGVQEWVGGNEDCTMNEGEGFSGILVKGTDGIINFDF